MSRKIHYKMSIKDILIKYAPEDMKDFLEELSTVETQKEFNNIRNKDEYKAIFEQYPEFIPGKSKYNHSYNFDSWLNKKISKVKISGDLSEMSHYGLDDRTLELLKKFPKSSNLDIEQITTDLLEDSKRKEKEEKEEAARNIKAEANKNLNEKVAQTKHKTEERTKKDYEEQLKEKDERIKQLEEAKNNNNIINTRLKDYLRDNYIIDSPMTREELIKKVSADPNLNAVNERIINKYADYILGKQLHKLITSKNKIIKTAKLFGNDADYLSKLDPAVREAVLKYQTDYINKTITDKNNKYLLPKKYIKFEKAINNYKVNPLILRGLYVK